MKWSWRKWNPFARGRNSCSISVFETVKHVETTGEAKDLSTWPLGEHGEHGEVQFSMLRSLRKQNTAPVTSPPKKTVAPVQIIQPVQKDEHLKL